MTGATAGAALRDAASQLRDAGIDDPDLEADVLLRHALGLGADRAHLLAMLHDDLPSATVAQFEELLARRLRREPTAYITGHREFYGLDLLCSPAALIPRPETELLVDVALQWLERHPRLAQTPLVVDVGTGNGALAVALAANRADASVVAIDTSSDALRLARENAGRHGVADRVAFVQGDLLTPLRHPADVIVANLPYVSARDWEGLAPEINRYEPKGALVGGPSGTELILRLLAQAPGTMKQRSLLVCEIGDTQGEALQAAATTAFPEARIEVRPDLAGLDRALYVER